ncbi:MAG: anhydro-N-acetylmuramic acid kinase [Candidatus Sericytochromatia bacterium]
MNPLLKVLGLMSGTSLDGLDIALVEIYETRGNFHIKNTHFKTYSYPEELKNKLITNINPKKAKLESLSDINFELGSFFSDKILEFIKDNALDKNDIDLIASHGHTFYHNVKNGKVISTLQLGDPSVIAVKTGITTVGDFRNADIASDGQGAPLVPFVDNLLFRNKNKNFVLQNIGGIANLTYISKNPEDRIIAFDSGPGNMIIDALMDFSSLGRYTYDKDGEFAASGNINRNILQELLNNDYFKMQPPKSTGRELFGVDYTNILWEKYIHEKAQDLIATITFFTAKTIVEAYQNFLPNMPDEVVISGGGAKNKTLVKFIKDLLPKTVKVTNFEEYGIISDAKEAVAFAVLGYCTFFGITNNLPSATGAKENVIMGKICPAKNFNRILLKNKLDSSNSETTEQLNYFSEELDLLEPLEIVELMNKSDYDVILAVENAKIQIAEVLSNSIKTVSNNGSIFYIGAGTSGRLGILDASECPPTFKADPQTVQGIIAGGEYALTNAVEGAEDIGENGRNDIKAKVKENDIVIGISANGKAPYVIEALEEAKKIGAKTALITCNNLEKQDFIDTIISLKVGPEILSGSTRLKAGTVTKMVLNIITTGTFSKTGKVFGNYMVDLKVLNKKLKKRGAGIIQKITKCTEEESYNLLEKAEGNVKHAILMQLKGIDYEKAKIELENNKGFLRSCL